MKGETTEGQTIEGVSVCVLGRVFYLVTDRGRRSQGHAVFVAANFPKASLTRTNECGQGEREIEQKPFCQH